jgi:hypothetical protein
MRFVKSKALFSQFFHFYREKQIFIYFCQIRHNVFGHYFFIFFLTISWMQVRVSDRVCSTKAWLHPPQRLRRKHFPEC